MNTVKSDTKIYIEPRFFDSKIKQHIIDKVKEQTFHSCIDEIGYVMNVDKINTIKNIHSNLFIVNSDLIVFKPKKDTVYDTIVRMIFKEGIFVEINDIQKVLIPTSSIKDRYEYTDKIFICKDTKKSVVNGMELKVKLTAIKYYNNKFNCIGQIV